MGLKLGEYGSDGHVVSYLMSFEEPCLEWNDPRSGLLQMSGRRLFQSLAVLGK